MVVIALTLIFVFLNFKPLQSTVLVVVTVMHGQHPVAGGVINVNLLHTSLFSSFFLLVLLYLCRLQTVVKIFFL